MLQIILTLAIFVILVIPMGKYMYHIATKQKTFADKVFNPIDRCIYKAVSYTHLAPGDAGHLGQHLQPGDPKLEERKDYLDLCR